MKVLVAYASRHGATHGIAERIAQTLDREGLKVTLQRVTDVDTTAGYDAFVIGSAAYMFHWLKEAKDFVKRHQSTLSTSPVWLFSSGPLGTDQVDAKGQDVRTAAEPREFAELVREIGPRDTQIFFGAYDPTAKPVGMAERLMGMLPGAREGLPAGDFRDWAEIEGWATGIARALAATPVEATAVTA